MSPRTSRLARLARIVRDVRTSAPRQARRRPLEAPDTTAEAAPGLPPEPVFDRATGPYVRRSEEP